MSSETVLDRLKNPQKPYKHACDPVLADCCCEMVALRTIDDEGVRKGMRYHAHLFEGGQVLVNVPMGEKPYVAKNFDFVRVVEDHHEF